MNKQEYEQQLKRLYEGYSMPDTNMPRLKLYLDSVIKADKQYIASLESENTALKSENAQLKADNINLMKQVEVTGKALDLACDFTTGISGETPSHWKGYYLKKAGE